MAFIAIAERHILGREPVLLWINVFLNNKNEITCRFLHRNRFLKTDFPAVNLSMHLIRITIILFYFIEYFTQPCGVLSDIFVQMDDNIMPCLFSSGK